MQESPRARIIAIDGPAASGKSVVGQRVAAILGYRFYDTGAMYRALTWLALERRIDPHDARALAALAQGVRIEVDDVAEGDPEQRTRVRLDGVDATPHLREADVEANVSLVSRVPELRAVLVAVQRELASAGGVVMAGRDIGTVVLPDAHLKVYLDASERVRAQRRAAQRGKQGDAQELSDNIARRDALDSTRVTSPLTRADDAVIIETDDLSVDQVVERIVELAR